MSDRADHDHLLDALAREGPGAPPPPAFLAAVGRRRRQRRLRQLSSLAAVITVVAAAALALRPSPPPLMPAPIARSAAPSTLAALARMNPDPTADHLILPAASSPDPEQPLQIGLRWDPDRIERWVAH